MSPGQCKYIEGRIEDYDQRARWLRMHCKTAEAQDHHHGELADLEAKIAKLRAQLSEHLITRSEELIRDLDQRMLQMRVQLSNDITQRQDELDSYIDERHRRYRNEVAALDDQRWAVVEDLAKLAAMEPIQVMIEAVA